MACVYLILLLYYPVDVQPHVDVQGIAVSIIHFNLKKKISMHVDLELLYYRKHDDDDGDDNEEDDDDVSKEVPDSSPALCLHVLSSLPLIYWLL